MWIGDLYPADKCEWHCINLRCAGDLGSYHAAGRGSGWHRCVASFTAITQIRTATAVQPVEYVAAGAIVAWTPQLNVDDNTASTAGVPVDWRTISGPITASPGQSPVNTQGIASTLATAGPLAPGAQALLSGCAWTSVCATFTTQGVDPAELRLVAVSGAGQIVSASGALTPVVLLVTDEASHPVAGAVVQIYQTVDAWQLSCPDRRRCPIPPVLSSTQYSRYFRCKRAVDDNAAATCGHRRDDESRCGYRHSGLSLPDPRKTALEGAERTRAEPKGDWSIK